MKLPTIEMSRLLKPGRALAEGWQAFWFTPADPTVLGLIRIFTGFVLVWILLASTPFLTWLYAANGWVDLNTTNIFRRETPMVPPPEGWDEEAMPPMIRPELSMGPAAEAYRQRWGVDPGQTIDMGTTIFSQWFHVTDPGWMQFVHWLAVVVAVLFTLGVATRVTSVLAWVLTLGYIHRTQESLFGMDTMLTILLLYLMIGPAGAALSLDRLIQRFRTSLASLSRRKPLPPPGPIPSVSANVALRLLQIHFCIIYLASGASKLQGAAWWNGRAVWQTFSNYEFTPERFVYFTPMLRWLSSHRVLWEIVNSGGSVFTLALELGLPFLIWFPRWRWVMVIGAVFLHTGIAAMMSLNAFSLLMLLILMAFIPAATVNALLAQLFRGSSEFWLLFSSRPAVGVRLASLIHVFDAWGQVTPVDAAQVQRGEDEPAWLSVPTHLSRPQLVCESGQTLSGYPLLERVVRSLRILWPAAVLTWLPGAARLGRSIAPPSEEEDAIPQEVTAGS